MNGGVRVKDKFRSAYTPEQWLGVQIESIGAERFYDRTPISGWQIRTAIYNRPGDYKWIDGKWRSYSPGEIWGGAGITAFFRCGFRVPKSWSGARVMLRLKPGGEGLLKLNGAPLAGLDINHDTVFVTERARAGDLLKLEIEQNSTEMEIAGFEHKFELCEAVLLDREVEDAYIDFKCAYATLLSEYSAADLKAFLFKEISAAVALADFHAADRGAFRESLSAARAALRKSVFDSGAFPGAGSLGMVGHSHIDLVYQWGYREFLRKIGRTHSTALNMTREFPDYIFSQSQMKLYEDLKTLYPEIYDGIKRRVREGAWEVLGGMWVEPDCNLISGESLIRQFLHGRAFAASEFGAESPICWLPDVFGNSWIMPQILLGCGVRFFITNKPVTWNDTNEFPHNTFWWEGPDGSRVFAHLPSTHFGAVVEPDTLMKNWKEYKQQAHCGIAMYNYGKGDGRGGPMRDDVLAGRRFAEFPGVPRSVFSTAEDVLKRMEAAAVDLPVWKDEIYLETHRGTYTTQAILKKFNRKNEINFWAAEAVSCAAALAGCGVPKADLNDGWKIVLKNQFHDILPGSHVTEAREEAVEECAQAAAICRAAFDKAVSAIASNIEPPSPSAPAAAVFNCRPWERADSVEIEFAARMKKFSVLDSEGVEVPFQVLSRGKDKTRVLICARGLPPMGYATFTLSPEPGDEPSSPFSFDGRSASNSFFKITFADDGSLDSVFDILNGREALAPGGGNRFRIFQDTPGRYAAWDIVPMYKDLEMAMPGAESSEVEESGPVRMVIRQTRSFYRSKLTQRIILYRDIPRIDFQTEIDWRERDRLLKVEFPAAVNAMRATYDLSCGHIERPTHYNTSWDRAKFEVCGHQWADISEGDYGVSLLNDCKYGHDIFGNVIRLTLLKGAQSPDPTSDLGMHEFTYSLYPHAGGWRDAETPRRAWELNDPATAVALGGAAAARRPRGPALPPLASFLSVDRSHVMLMAFKAAEDGDGYIARFCEIENRRGKTKVEFFRPVRRAVECDLMENKTGPAAVSRGALSFDIAPFKIKTFRLFFA